jgi:hypothetical protein
LSKRSVRIGSRCNPRAIRPVASKAGWDALTCDSRVLLALRHNAHSPNGHLAAPAPRVPNLGRGAWEGPRTWTRAPEHAHAVGTAVGTGLPPPLEVFCAGGKILLFGETDDGTRTHDPRLGKPRRQRDGRKRPRTRSDANPHGYWDCGSGAVRTCGSGILRNRNEMALRWRQVVQTGNGRRTLGSRGGRAASRRIDSRRARRPGAAFPVPTKAASPRHPRLLARRRSDRDPP